MGIVVTGRVESVLGAISIETYAIERKGTSLSAKLMMAILSFPRNEKPIGGFILTHHSCGIATQ